MPHSFHFFEIPVYRCTAAKHKEEHEKAKRKFMAPIEESKSIAPANYENADVGYEIREWYSWRYNEVIGWIRLYKLGTQIRGELWFTDSKKISRGSRKKFICLGKMFELSFYSKQSEDEIRSKVLKAIELASKEKPIKGRYIDFECFEAAAPMLRWRHILEFENKA